MKYLGSEYALNPVAADTYVQQAKTLGAIQLRRNRLGESLRIVIRKEAPQLADAILSTGNYLSEIYGEGGGLFCVAMGASLGALRTANPQVQPVNLDDWNKGVDREVTLKAAPGIVTIENESGIGLLEVRNVNPTYVDGYEEAFGGQGLVDFLGFTGLGAVMAHDIMHFASQRQPA